MNKFILLIILTIVVLFSFALGVFYEVKKTEKATEALKNLSLKSLVTTNVYGKVSDISARNITISNKGSNITFQVAQNATFNFQDTTGSKFEDIKEGDVVSVILNILTDGSTEGTSVVIFSNMPAPF